MNVVEAGDRDLIAACLDAGREAAVAEIHRRYARTVYSVCMRHLGNKEDAEDATIACFLVFLEKVHGLVHLESLGGWLYNCALNVGRRARRAQIRREQRDKEFHKMNTTNVCEDRWQSVMPELEMHIAALPAVQRETVVLEFYHGLTRKEIAQKLNCAENTVHRTMSIALGKLRSKMRRVLGNVAPDAIADKLKASVLLLPMPATLTAKLVAVATGGTAGTSAVSLANETLRWMFWTKAKSFAAIAASVLVVAGSVVAAAQLGGGKAEEPKAAAVAPVESKAGPAEQKSVTPASVPVAEKVPGKDYPYGEGVVYRREVFLGAFAYEGSQDGPALEIEGNMAVTAPLPNGDCYLMYSSGPRMIRKYDARKKRVYTIAWRGPYGKRGGLPECARFGGGAYHGIMTLGADSEGRPIIYDPTNRTYWMLNPETGMIEVAPGGDFQATVKGSVPDGSLYFAKDDGKLKKLLPDEKTVQDLGVTLEPPLTLPSYFGGLAVSEKTGRLYAGSRDPQGPWGVFWYWDMKSGKATGLCGPKFIGGKQIGQDGGEVDKKYYCSSGPMDKVSFWCTGGPKLGPDRGERYLYLPGGDESTCSRLDLEKKYVTKLVHADAKDRSLWTFGEGRQGADYRFGDPYTWAGAPTWGRDGEFYMGTGCLDVYRPVGGQSGEEAGK